MEIITTNITQIYIFNFDDLPFRKLQNPKYQEIMKKLFSFGELNITQDNNANIAALNYFNGIYNEDENEVSILRLNIEERKIVFQIEGNSTIADKFFSELQIVFNDVAGKKQKKGYIVPVWKSEESEIIAKMDFNINDLFVNEFNKFMEVDVVPKANLDQASAYFRPELILFSIGYIQKDKKLEENRITLVRKEFAIGVQRGRELHERIYFSKAPFDTKTHKSLLEKLEGKLLVS
jgi:hypothetical protein